MIGRKVKYNNRNLEDVVGTILDKVTSTSKRKTQVVDNGKVYTLEIPMVIDHYVIRYGVDGEIDIVECKDVIEVL